MPLTFTPGRKLKNINEYIGSNGMRLLLVPKPGLDVVTANITYHVGSRNEGLLLTGATHYLEHGMFKGSKKFKGKNGMWKLEELGAYMNATTYTDRTNYFEVLQTKDLKEAIIREADRMSEPLLTQELLSSEMSVVRNEYERGENNAFQVLQKRIVASAFMAHPYHHSTIGWKSDIEHVSAKALKQFHDTYYKPDNCTYTFVGNFDPVEVTTMVSEAFDGIGNGNPVPTMYTEEPVQTGQRRVVVKRPSNTNLLGIAFKSVHGMHRDSIVLEVLSRLLASGPTAPVEKLKQSGVVHDVMPSWERMKDPYLYMVWVTTNYPTAGALEKAENAVFNLLTNFPKPSENDLEMAKKEIHFEWKEAMESTRGLASEINEAISRGDPFDVENRFDVLNSVTADDILRVARETFDKEQSTVGWFLPSTSKKIEPSKDNYSVGVYPKAPSIQSLEKPKSETLNFKNITEVTPTCYFTKYDSKKTYIRMSLQTNANAFNAFEHVSRELLSELMTKGVSIKNKTFNETKVHSFLNENGIDRIAVPSANGIHFIISTPSEDPKVIQQLINLAKQEIQSPILNKATFDYLKNKRVAELSGSGNDVNEQANVHFSQALFQQGSFNYRHSVNDLKDALYNLSHHDITEEHTKLVNTGIMKMSIVSGSDAILSICKEKTNFVKFDEMKYQNKCLKEAKQLNIDIPGKTSCTVKWGHILPSTNQLALKIAIGALGNGFSGRLMKKVRDEEGLTYGIYASLNELYGANVFEVTATFSPDLLHKGIVESEKVIQEWSKGVTQEEVDIQKQILIGSRVVKWDNPQHISSTLHKNLLQGKNIHTIDAFENDVQKVTLEDVNKALKSSIQMNILSRIIAGSIPKQYTQ